MATAKKTTRRNGRQSGQQSGQQSGPSKLATAVRDNIRRGTAISLSNKALLEDLGCRLLSASSEGKDFNDVPEEYQVVLDFDCVSLTEDQYEKQRAAYKAVGQYAESVGMSCDEAVDLIEAFLIPHLNREILLHKLRAFLNS